jgi:hypothetical protein
MEPPRTEAEREDLELRLQRLRQIVQFLDDAVKIPVINYRVGFDGLIGLFPVAGDVITGGISLYVVYEAKQLGCGRKVISKMLTNVAADVVVGSVPLVGDLADIAFKSNRRNLKLLEKEIEEALQSEGAVIEADSKVLS